MKKISLTPEQEENLKGVYLIDATSCSIMRLAAPIELTKENFKIILISEEGKHYDIMLDDFKWCDTDDDDFEIVNSDIWIPRLLCPTELVELLDNAIEEQMAEKVNE